MAGARASSCTASCAWRRTAIRKRLDPSYGERLPQLSFLSRLSYLKFKIFAKARELVRE
jgi:hypothetical protein